MPAGRPSTRKTIEEVKVTPQKEDILETSQKPEPINLSNVEELLLQIKNGLIDIENELIKLNENLTKEEPTIDTRKLLLETKQNEVIYNQTGQENNYPSLENMKLNDLSVLIEMLGEIIRLNNYSGGNVASITKANTALAKVRKEIDNRVNLIAE